MLDKYAFCISVDGQRYADFCRNCARVGFKQMPARIGYRGVSPLFKACSPKSSYYTRSHHIHCAYNHYRALQEAVLKNFPYVVIYEDDAYPCTDLMDKFQMNLRALQELKEDWGCLVLGLNGLTREATIDHVHSQFMRIDRGLCGSHAYLVRQAYYGEALARFSGWMHSGPADAASDRSLCYPPLQTLVLRRFLFIQKNGNQFKYPRGYRAHGYYGPTHQSDIPPSDFVI